MHFERENVYQSIKKTSTGSITFVELSLSFLACDALTAPHYSTIFRRSNSNIFSLCYTSTLYTIHFIIEVKFKKDKYKMEIKNLAWNENLSKHCNHPLLPQGIRGLIIGKYGCGKTTLLVNLYLRPGLLDYNKINIFGKSLFQPEYHIRKKAYEEKLPKDVIIGLFENQNEITDFDISPISIVEKMAKEVTDESDVVCNFYQLAEDVSDPRELSPEKKNLMVFDDMLLEKQNTCEWYYVRGRHSNVDCFYLAQNYFKLPRQTIRENANFMSVFPRPEEPKPPFRGSCGK